MSLTKKRILSTLGVLIAIAWASFITYRASSLPSVPEQRLGFDSAGGGPITSGGGLSRVTTNSAGLLAGSGTLSNPLTATLTVASPVSGTGSSGSALTSSGDISAVTAGSGLGGG